jgi:hypothetical protein
MSENCRSKQIQRHMNRRDIERVDPLNPGGLLPESDPRRFSPPRITYRCCGRKREMEVFFHPEYLVCSICGRKVRGLTSEQEIR